MIDTIIHDLMLLNEEDDPLHVKKMLDVMGRCQICSQWIDMYTRSSEGLKDFLKPILDYYVQQLIEVL